MDPKFRFTDRVTSYVRGRPGYPADLIKLLRSECGLNPTSVVADVGSGTGILSKMLCEVAKTVYGIEPNWAMRETGRSFLADNHNFLSVEGSAEDTTLEGTSVDLITVAQAFHWFHATDTRHEFLRILKPNGWAAIIYNDRIVEGSRLGEAYEKLLEQFGIDYHQVKKKGKAVIADLELFFGHSDFKKATFPNQQYFDREGFIERVTSASYMPNRNHPQYRLMLDAVKRIFFENYQGGHVVLDQETNVYYGQMT